jgi:hypothetical protein
MQNFNISFAKSVEFLKNAFHSLTQCVSLQVEYSGCSAILKNHNNQQIRQPKHNF